MKAAVVAMLVLTQIVLSLTLRIGYYDNYPLCFSKDGRAEGFYIDILNYIAKKEDWKIEYVYGIWEDLIEKLKDGKIDALVAIAFTPERARFFLFNSETFITNWGVVVSRKKMESIFDLENMKLALVKDDVYAWGLIKLLKRFKVKPSRILEFDTYLEALKMLHSGKVDAAAVSRISALMYKSKYHYRITPIVFTPVELRIALSRKFPFAETVAARIDEHLRKMKSNESSIYQAALKKYLLEEKSFPLMKFLGIFSAVLVVLLAVLLYMFLVVRRKSKTLKIANENLKAASEQIKIMDSQIKDLYDELQRTFDKFQEIMEIVASISTFEIPEEEFLKKVLDLALDLIPKAKYGSVSLIEGERWRFVYTVGHDIEILKKLNLKREYAFYDLKRPLIIDRIFLRDKQVIPEPEYSMMRRASKPTKSSLIVPLKIGENLIGFFSLDIPEGSEEDFNKKDADIAGKFARIVSSFYAVRKYKELEEKSYRDMLIVLTKALEYYDIYTRGHSERVAALSEKLARKLRLPEDRVKKVYWAALVHDIGKIYVSHSVLNKPSRLTDEEYEQIKMHPVKGYEMLKDSSTLADLAVIVLYHHERCDGHGYPEGLKCDQIPFESRIIAVVDAFDAMTSARAYRDPMSVDQAIIELLKNAGTQFDPEIVKAFIEMIEEMRSNRAAGD